MGSRYCYSNADFIDRMQRHERGLIVSSSSSLHERVLVAERSREEFPFSRRFFRGSARDKRLWMAQQYMRDLRRFL